MKIIASICTATLLLFSTSMYAQTQSLKDFDGIQVSGNLDVTLVNSNNNSLDVEMVKGDSDNLVTEVQGNTLVLKVKSNWFGSKTKANITVYHDGVSSMDVSAGAYVHTSDTMSGDKMSVEVSSGAKCNASVDVATLTIEISSGASSTIKGSSNKQTVEVSSGASYNGQMLESDDTSVDVSSGASAKVWANEKINAEASSGGSIQYKGDPSISNVESGKYSGGSIRKI